MDESRSEPYLAPPIDPARAVFGPRVEVVPGVGFVACTEPSAPDEISQSLAAGRFPVETRAAVEYLQALTPRGGRVLDLGGHVGTFTLAAAALGYEVICFEASPRNAAVLRASLEHNRFARARLVHAAVSDRAGTLEFEQGGPFGHVGIANSGAPTVSVPAITVDDIVAQAGWKRVDFIKIDIEGSEIAGLAGMKRLLSDRGAPPLFIESNGHTLAMFNQTPETLKGVLESYGYRNYLVDESRLCPVRPHDFQAITCVDYLAVKRAPRGSRQFLVDRPLSLEETVSRVQRSASSPALPQRAYIARALRDAPPAVLASEAVQSCIEALRNDPEAQVREAARAIVLPKARRFLFARWHPPRLGWNLPHFRRTAASRSRRGADQGAVSSVRFDEAAGSDSPK